jgi:hypothetical protein
MTMKLPTNRTEARLLRRALLGNAVFSAFCGVSIVAFDTRIVALMTNLQHHLWPLGVMLIGFAASLAWFSTRPAISSAWVTSVIVADLAWVAGTVALLAGWHGKLTATGLWIVAAVGLLVFAFAELQWLGLRRLRSSTQNP